MSDPVYQAVLSVIQLESLYHRTLTGPVRIQLHEATQRLAEMLQTKVIAA